MTFAQFEKLRTHLHDRIRTEIQRLRRPMPHAELERALTDFESFITNIRRRMVASLLSERHTAYAQSMGEWLDGIINLIRAARSHTLDQRALVRTLIAKHRIGLMQDSAYNAQVQRGLAAASQSIGAAVPSALKTQVKKQAAAVLKALKRLKPLYSKVPPLEQHATRVEAILTALRPIADRLGAIQTTLNQLDNTLPGSVLRDTLRDAMDIGYRLNSLSRHLQNLRSRTSRPYDMELFRRIIDIFNLEVPRLEAVMNALLRW